MRGQGRRVSRQALLVGIVVVALVLGCDVVATGPSGSPTTRTSADAAGPPRIADVTTFRGDVTRTGRMPGPGPEGEPVELWRVDTAAGFEAQPLVAGGVVLAVSTDGEVLALDAVTGARRWGKQLPAGVTGTPAIADDTMFVVTQDGELRALSLTERTERWHEPGYDALSSPAVAADLVLAGGANGELIARRAADGTKEWSAPAPGAARVAVADGRAAASGDGSDQLTVVDVDDGAGIFEQHTGGADTGTAALVDGKAYIAHRDVAGGANGVYAFDATGRELWHFVEPDRLRIDGTAISDDTVFAFTEVPLRVHAIDRETGKALWSRDVDARSIGGGAVADGLLYMVGGKHGLFALDTSTGEVVWTVPLEVTTRPSRPVVTGGLVIVATNVDGAGRVVAFAGASDSRRPDTASPIPPRAFEASPSPISSLPTAPGLVGVDVHDVEPEAVLVGGALAPDGTLYAPDVANNRILVMDPDGQQHWWGSIGTGKGEFDFSEVTQNDASAGVAVSPDGQLIAVGEGGNHRVQLFDGERNHIRFIGRTGRDDGQFVNPCCPTVDADHRIWVVDPGRADVQVFGEDGRFLNRFASEGSGPGQLVRPSTAFVREDANEVLVADFGNHRVAVFAMDGTWLRAYESRPKDKLNLGEVNAVMVGIDGRMLVLDAANWIYILDAAGSPLLIVQLSDAGFGPIDTAGIAISPTGRLYVVDLGHHRIVEAQLAPSLWPVDTARP